MHMGTAFGRGNQIVSTLLACVFMVLAGAAAAMWWKRRPQGNLDFTVPGPAPNLPAAVKTGLALLGLLMPLAGLSIVLLALRSTMRAKARTT